MDELPIWISNFSINFCRVSISWHPFQHTHVGRCRVPSGPLTIFTCGQVMYSLRNSDHPYLLYIHYLSWNFLGLVIVIPWLPSTDNKNFLNAAPWVGLVIKSPIMSAVGHHCRESLYFSVISVSKYYLMFMCFVRLLLEALPLFSKIIAPLLYLYTVF